MNNSNDKKTDSGFNRRDLFKTGLVLAGGSLLSSACTTSAKTGKSNSSKATVWNSITPRHWFGKQMQ